MFYSLDWDHKLNLGPLRSNDVTRDEAYEEKQDHLAGCTNVRGRFADGHCRFSLKKPRMEVQSPRNAEINPRIGIKKAMKIGFIVLNPECILRKGG